jgi:hypothetical protein
LSIRPDPLIKKDEISEESNGGYQRLRWKGGKRRWGDVKEFIITVR